MRIRTATYARAATVIAGLLVATALAQPQAHAMQAPEGTLSVTFPESLNVGGKPGTITIQGTNPTDFPITVDEIKVLPSCAGTVQIADTLGCSQPDPGVFSVAVIPQGTFAPCPAQFGDPTPADSGIVSFPVSGLIVPGGGTCSFSFRLTAMKVPVGSSDPAVAGATSAPTNTGVGVVGSMGTMKGELDVVGPPITVVAPGDS